MKAYAIDKPLSERLSVLQVILTVFILYIHIHNVNSVSFSDGDFLLAREPAWLSLTKDTLSDVIARVAVPLFFLISSVLLYAKPFTWAGNLKKKCVSILIPYFFWNTFWLLFFFVAQSIPLSQPYFATRIIREYTLPQFIAVYFPIPGGGLSPFYYPFWFLFDLFILNLFARAIQLLADKFPVLLTAACVTAWLFSLDLVLFSSEALLFFLLGYLIVKNRLTVDRVDSLAMPDLFAAWLASIAVAIPFLWDYRVLLKASILVGILFFIRLAGLIVASDNRRLKGLFAALIPYTFVIYAVHDWLQGILRKLLVRLVPQNPAIQLLEYLLIPVAAILICVLFGMVFQRLLPGLYKLATGNRGTRGVRT